MFQPLYFVLLCGCAVALKMVAPVAERTQLTFGGAGGAHGRPMEHQPVAEIVGFLRRKYGSELLFHLSRVLGAVGETQPASDPNAVGVGHHYAGFVKDVALNQVGGFPAHAGEF